MKNGEFELADLTIDGFTYTVGGRCPRLDNSGDGTVSDVWFDSDARMVYIGFEGVDLFAVGIERVLLHFTPAKPEATESP